MRVPPPPPPLDILVVDDEQGARTALATAIHSFGYPVRVAATGRDALALHQERPAAIVLTDWSMPGMTGLELCVALKHGEATPHVVVITGFDEHARLIEALRDGADEFMPKPLDIDELEARLFAAGRRINGARELVLQSALRRRDRERASRVSHTDPLSTLPSRELMEEALERAIIDASRSQRRCCVAIFDIDHFGRYNDRNGPFAGDLVLHHVALALLDGVRASGSVFRLGGEEFLILFPQEGAEEVAATVEHIRASVEALGIENGLDAEPGALTISAGVAELRGRDKRAWLARANAALCRAKAGGRNRIAIV